MLWLLHVWLLPALGAPTPPSTHFKTLSASADQTCGVYADGSLRCWGAPAEPPPTGTDFVGVVAGVWSVCGWTAQGEVRCNKEKSIGRPKPRTEPPTEPVFNLVMRAQTHMCALREDKTIACWGETHHEPPPPGPFVQLGPSPLGGNCAVRSDGSVACWDVQSFLKVRPPAEDFVALSGGSASCGLRRDRSILCWDDEGVSDALAGPFTSVVGRKAGGCGLTEAGEASCWGASAKGVPAGPFVQLTAGDRHTCGLLPDGRVDCWGRHTRARVPYDDLAPVPLKAAAPHPELPFRPVSDPEVLSWAPGYAGEPELLHGAFVGPFGPRDDGVVVVWANQIWLLIPDGAGGYAAVDMSLNHLSEVEIEAVAFVDVDDDPMKELVVVGVGPEVLMLPQILPGEPANFVYDWLPDEAWAKQLDIESESFDRAITVAQAKKALSELKSSAHD